MKIAPTPNYTVIFQQVAEETPLDGIIADKLDCLVGEVNDRLHDTLDKVLISLGIDPDPNIHEAFAEHLTHKGMDTLSTTIDYLRLYV